MLLDPTSRYIFPIDTLYVEFDDGMRHALHGIAGDWVSVLDGFADDGSPYYTNALLSWVVEIGSLVDPAYRLAPLPTADEVRSFWDALVNAYAAS